MPTMLAGLNPGWVLIIAGVASLFITMRSVRQVVTIAAPLLALLVLVLVLLAVVATPVLVLVLHPVY